MLSPVCDLGPRAIFGCQARFLSSLEVLGRLEHAHRRRRGREGLSTAIETHVSELVPQERCMNLGIGPAETRWPRERVPRV